MAVDALALLSLRVSRPPDSQPPASLLDMSTTTNTFVKAFTHLKDRPKADKALPLLQRIASLVKPIMRKHGWVLPVLSEFFPESPNLVGTQRRTPCCIGLTVEM